MRTLELTDEQYDMILAAISYLYSNLDDVNEALEKEFDENAVDELMAVLNLNTCGVGKMPKTFFTTTAEERDTMIATSERDYFIYNEIRDLMGDKPFPMSLVGEDAQVVIAAVNQGIDSRLEACNCPDRGDHFGIEPQMLGDKHIQNRLECSVSPQSMPTLLRRLYEVGGDDLADSIIDILVRDAEEE